MINKTITLTVLAVMLLALQTACAPKNIPQYPEPQAPGPYPPPYPPGDAPVSSDNPGVSYPSPLDALPGEENMRRGEVYLDSVDLLSLESYPVQIMLRVTGNLPNPCFHLRAKMSQPDEQNRIDIELFAVVEPDKICVDMLEPFDVSFSLGSFKDGKYTVWVNGKQVGEFSSP